MDSNICGSGDVREEPKITLVAAAKILGVCVSTVRTMIARGELEAVLVGKKIKRTSREACMRAMSPITPPSPIVTRRTQTAEHRRAEEKLRRMGVI
jgi:excisionase family DNA binding protein